MHGLSRNVPDTPSQSFEISNSWRTSEDALTWQPKKPSSRFRKKTSPADPPVDKYNKRIAKTRSNQVVHGIYLYYCWWASVYFCFFVGWIYCWDRSAASVDARGYPGRRCPAVPRGPPPQDLWIRFWGRTFWLGPPSTTTTIVCFVTPGRKRWWKKIKSCFFRSSQKWLLENVISWINHMDAARLLSIWFNRYTRTTRALHEKTFGLGRRVTWITRNVLFSHPWL